MFELLKTVLNNEEKNELRQFISAVQQKILSNEHNNNCYLLRNQILQIFAEYCSDRQKPAYFYRCSSLGELLHYTHELILEKDNFYLIIRPRVNKQEFFRISIDLTRVEPVTIKEILNLRDRTVNHQTNQDTDILEIDFQPFYEPNYRIKDPRNIGQGIEFLNHYLSGKLFEKPQQSIETLLKFLGQHNFNGIKLLINAKITTPNQLSEQVKTAIEFINKIPPDTPYLKFHYCMQDLGFEPGWGNNAATVQQTLKLLYQLIESPYIETENTSVLEGILEAFISRIPLNFYIVLVSVNAWFGQAEVLGRPDTAGQVVYVLNQARSLEKQLQIDLKIAGLDVLGIKPKVIILTRLIPNAEGTSCYQRLEKIQDTDNGWILRVPFREFNSKITQNWISKFEIWPYLETFAIDAEKELCLEFGGIPHLIVGNYSDGNLVAFLLAKRWKITQCYIAHVLEKPKYLFSNLYWQELEEQYHFSLQFTADVIGMNAADFIINSSYQEIVGTPESFGQYESYQWFSMPTLYHVIHGIDLFSPKFNVVPPGVNENIFFPYTQLEKRVSLEKDRIKDLLLIREDPQIIGKLTDINKIPIFAIAPMNPNKNLTGLVECFGNSQKLQEYCNLIIITHQINTETATNSEEREEIEKMHSIIDRYNLNDKMRWLGLRLTTPDTGEVYRVIAECKGIFVHPARFEAFGLTVIEAMISGLPTFATQFGGPLEIIQDGENGFHINPTDLEATAVKIINFIEQCQVRPEYWQEISDRAIKRISDKYNWQNYSKQLLLLAKVYSFWNYPLKQKQAALLRYLEVLYHLIYKPRAAKLLDKHSQKVTV